ncbi:unnamed protein product [Rotaria sp. Silwood1]|nr:unnamed protein product [Rotaria sp. Silwood1]CAF1635647.1 unnamed protein product [Rotaria sp. Silwood1]
MSTNEQPAHVSLTIPSERPPPSDNFHFMNDTFTLPQDGQSGSTQIPLSQGYAGKTEFDTQVRHRGWLGGTLDEQSYGQLLDTTNDDDDDTNADENRPLL